MKALILTLMTLLGGIAYAQTKQAVIDGRTYLCTPADDNTQIALLCYENCRGDGGSHPYCNSTCNAQGIPGVRYSCYKKCIETGGSHLYCNSTCQ
ncbi:MAG: hypothetical protein KDD22_08290 [Bdellovibrionales bacterium]|nr:hypothetical protein [Bdellovibrionales bacterium]